MALIHKVLKSWLLAYIIAIIGQQILMILYKISDWLPFNQIANQLSQAYILIFSVILAYLLFNDVLYIIAVMLIVIIQPSPISLFVMILSILLMYVCRSLTMLTYELLGLLLSFSFTFILTIVILPLFHFELSILALFYQSILALSPSIFKIVIVTVVFSIGTLFPNNMNQLIDQITWSSDMLILASAASTIFIVSLSTLSLYLGAIKESMIQCFFIPAIQLINVIRQPIVIVIPLIVTLILSPMVYLIIPIANSNQSVFYGSSFLIAIVDGIKLNGNDLCAWANVLTMYMILPILLTWIILFMLDKISAFKKISMVITRQTFQ